MKNEKPPPLQTLRITRDRAKEYIHAHLATGTDLQLENILDSMLFKRKVNTVIVPDDFENDNCLL
jgi:hypothetical protein